ARRADVSIHGGRVTAVGELPKDPNARDVDLDGLALAPGFIDIHTHYDAQVLWDGGLSPSPWHGVTTVVLGNCGFGIAPTKPADRDLVLGILELVEDMAPDALASGVSWDFESFPDYLDVLDRREKRINVVAFVGHTPIRIAAMGADAMERAATDDELATMRRLVAEARRAGAIGIASSLAANHVGPGGRPVPSYVGGLDELAALVDAMGTGVVEVARGRTPVEELRRCVRPGVTVSWSSLLTSRPGEPASHTELIEQTSALGGSVWPQVSCRPLTIQVALDNPVALGTIGAFREVLAKPPHEREAMYKDETWRQRCRAEVGESWRPIWERASALTGGVVDPSMGISVAAVARARGTTALDALVDLALEHGLHTRFDIPVANLDEHVVAELLRDPRTLLGLSDAGAHTNQQCDASFATHLLGYWCRERGVLTLEQAIWRLTGQPAKVYGFEDRGVIRSGAIADLVAFDPDTVGAMPLERVNDFPASTPRLISRSNGIVHTWVRGIPIRVDGEDRDVAAGVLMRAR
ncbi:MAG TPA: amidohydrolase family protein, partial [Acidimicrobiales bacterium]